MFSNLGKDRHLHWTNEVREWDTPDRIRVIISALLGLNHLEPVQMIDFLDEKEIQQLIMQVHSEKMVLAIKHASESCADGEKTSTNFDKSGDRGTTMIDSNTYLSAISSVASAVLAAKSLIQGDKISYSISRPPGHHAGKDFYHGFCYFNNAAVAANYLSNFGRVAILDIDVHHGDGTQDIFYFNQNVFFASLHADPSKLMPHTGTEKENGAGNGVNTTLNLPFDFGISAENYKGLAQKAMQAIKKFKPNFLVLSA